MIRPALLFAATALFPLASLAQGAADEAASDTGAPQIAASNVHLFSANPITAAVMMTLTNSGPDDCTLTAVEGDVAQQIALHHNVEEDGLMKMKTIEGGVPVPAGGEAQLGPDGSHIMLMGVNRPLAAGDTVDLTLDFGPCGTLPVTAQVVALPGHGADAAAAHHHGDAEESAGHDAADHGHADHDSADHGATDHSAADAATDPDTAPDSTADPHHGH